MFSLYCRKLEVFLIDLLLYFILQIMSQPLDKWLLKSSRSVVRSEEPVVIDMSRYLKKVTDELDQWLLHRVSAKQNDSGMEDESLISERLRPIVPSSLDLTGSHMSRADNPWIHKSRTSTRSSCSFSPVSRSSSFSSVSSKRHSYNKWLLKEDNIEDCTTGLHISCPMMDKFEKDVADVSWIKSDNNSMSTKNVNPMAQFNTEKSDLGLWLKPQGSSSSMLSDVDSPLQKLLNFQQSSSSSIWLLNSEEKVHSKPPCFEKMLDKGGNQWLFQPFNSFTEDDFIEEEMC